MKRTMKNVLEVFKRGEKAHTVLKSVNDVESILLVYSINEDRIPLVDLYQFNDKDTSAISIDINQVVTLVNSSKASLTRTNNIIASNNGLNSLSVDIISNPTRLNISQTDGTLIMDVSQLAQLEAICKVLVMDSDTNE